MPILKNLLIALLLPLAGCDPPPASNPAQGLALPDLVHAANAPAFKAEGGSYTEIVFHNGIWNIYHEGKWHADGRTEDVFFSALDKIQKKNRSKGREVPLLVSAPGTTPFRKITGAVRGAAVAGFPEVNFLASYYPGTREEHAFHLVLPHMGCEVRTDIEPLLVSLDSHGAVSTGLGAARETLDTDPGDPLMPLLTSQLHLYASAVRAASCVARVQVHADPAVTYQRVIDLLSRLHLYQITHIEFIDGTDLPGTKDRLDHLKTKSKILPAPPPPPPH